MKIAIICSCQDEAGMTIRKALFELYTPKQTETRFEDNPVYQLQPHTHIYTTNLNTVYCENLDQAIDADLFMFATKHESQSGIPCLSAHTQGNWAKADYGGKARELGISPACYLKEAIKRLDEWGHELKERGFDVIQEATHHGPFLSKPSMFIEIGSSGAQWNDMEAGKLIARVIHHLASQEPPACRTAVGLGGPHHTPNFRKLILNSDIALGHVCPKHNLQHLDKEMLAQALERTQPKADLIVLDWKGLDSKEKILEILKDSGIEVKRTKDY